MRRQHVFVVPFDFQKGQLVSVNPLPAASADGAIKRAEHIASHFAGVGVYGVWVDDVTYDASDLHEIARFGQVPELDAVRVAA